MNLLILPVELSDDSKLRAVYCTEENTLISIAIDHIKDSSSFGTIRKMYQELGVEDLDTTRIFKLGKIDRNPCYAVNVSGLKHDTSLVRVPFYKLMQGDYSDSQLLAASFLTVAYFA